jgi:hypothetical protein
LELSAAASVQETSAIAKNQIGMELNVAKEKIDAPKVELEFVQRDYVIKKEQSETKLL